MSRSRLSVVIPTYGAADLVVRAARSLGAMPSGCELLVVDDGSGGDTAARIGAALPEATVLSLERNRGFGAAVNTGFARAGGEFLATLNDDAITTWDDLLEITRFLDAHPEAGAASPAILDSAGRPLPSGFLFPRSASAKLVDLRQTVRARQRRAPAPGEAPRRVEYVRGACVVFRRPALDQVGLFDEQFRMFAEDIDLCRRLVAGGCSVWVVPSAQVVHDGGSSSRGHPDRARSSRYRLQSYASLCRYYTKHHTLPARLALRLELGVRVLGRLLKAAALAAVGGADPWWIGARARCLSVLATPWPSRPLEPELSVAGAQAPFVQSEEGAFPSPLPFEPGGPAPGECGDRGGHQRRHESSSGAGSWESAAHGTEGQGTEVKVR